MNYSQTPTRKALQRLFRELKVAPKDDEPDVIEDVFKRLSNPRGILPLNLKSFKLRRSRAFQLTSPSDCLLVAYADRSLRRITNVRQGNRSAIVANLKCVLQDASSYIVHRGDVRSFYESISREAVLSRLTRDLTIPRSTVATVKAVFEGAASATPPLTEGTPRGISLSATLAEDQLRAFDREMSAHQDMIFYARFVDDIVAVTSSKLDSGKYMALLERQLAAAGGLEPNATKCKSTIAPSEQLKAAVSFDYLGYSFTIGGFTKKQFRTVTLDIANAKLKRLKTRMCLSAAAFIADRDFGLFRDRLRLLAGNFRIFGDSHAGRLRAGLYYSYPLVTIPGSGAPASILEMDRFLRHLLCGRKANLSRRLRAALTTSQRDLLLRISFRSGFLSRRIVALPPTRQSLCRRVWTNA